MSSTTAAHRQVDVQRGALPRDWPEGQLDLIVLAEILYYFARSDLGQVVSLAVAAPRPGATLLAALWRHPVAGTAQRRHRPRRAGGRAGADGLAEHTEPDLIAGAHLAGQGQPVSVAAAKGLT